VEIYNGHVFALFGLYEYARLTGDQRALDLFDGGVTTALYAVGSIREPGSASYYCANQALCADTDWRAGGYHSVHIAQFAMLSQMADQPLFHDWARCLDSDQAYEPWPVAARWPQPELS
jgi:hypothetical protein